MIKNIAFVTPKAGMARQAFIDRYEQGHAPLALRILPPWTFCDYRRNYVVPGTIASPRDKTGAPVAEPDFLDISEFWYEDQATVDRFLRTLAETDVGQQITDDESEFMTRDTIVMVNVEEHASPAQDLAPRPAGHSGPPAFKLFLTGRKRDDMSREAFIRRYEEGHAPLALRIVRGKDGRPLAAGYNRNYPVPGPVFDLPHLDFDPPKPDFDVLTALWFWTQADLEAFSARAAEPEIAAALEEDEAQLFDLPQFRIFMVDEYVTSVEDLKAAGQDCPLPA